MTSPADEFIKKTVELRDDGRIDEALLSARHAVKVDSESANAWWQLALTQIEKDGYPSAVAALRKTVELSPNFAYGWYRLGMCYSKAAMQDQAIESFEKSIEIDQERDDAAAALLEAYRKRQLASDDEKIFGLLLILDEHGKLNAYNSHSLAIAYHKKKEYHRAIRYYRISVAESPDAGTFFNLGLAFSVPEVNQNADAIDAWRRGLAQDPEHVRAKASLESLMPKVRALRARVLSGQKILSEDQWYVNYINPLKLLNLANSMDGMGDDGARVLQKARRALLQEIELEEGKVEWMPGLIIDRSRAIQVCDEINNSDTYFRHVFLEVEEELLGFLSRGELNHFLVDENNSTEWMVKNLEKKTDDGFAKWLSQKFASQYDLVLTKAIEKRNVDAIECLLDGRRWVVPEHEDLCFEGAHRQADRLIEPLRLLALEAEKVKPSMERIQQVLSQGSMGKIIGMLPMAFQEFQKEVASLIRGISIDVNNHHDDAELSKSILVLGKSLALRSPSLQHKMDEDLITIENNIKEAHKDDASLDYQGANYSIKRDSVRFADHTLSNQDVRTLRWGVVTSQSGTVKTYAFHMAIGGLGAKVLTLNWTAFKDVEPQRELFNKFVNALFTYLLPRVMEHLHQELDSHQTIRIGAAIANKHGVLFMIPGWFGSKQELIPWSKLRSEIVNGDVVVTCVSNEKARIVLPMHEVDNAFALHLIIKNT